MLAGLAAGDVGIVVGTHALLTEEVAFASLGAVVIDEQHRFGVEQRATLRAKGADGDPDLLVMTATPDPAHGRHGDLRRPRPDHARRAAAGPRRRSRPSGCPARRTRGRTRPGTGCASEVAAGHRAFVVCPLVERLAAGRGQVGHRGVRAARGRRARRAPRRAAARPDGGGRPRGGDGPLPRRRARGAGGHDRHRGRRRRARGHRDGRSRAPTASASPSCTSCGAGSAGAARRAGATCSAARRATSGWRRWRRSTDGFELAEADLRLRGEGTLLGARQKGQSDLRLASLTDAGDLALLGEARRGGRGARRRGPAARGAPRPGRRGPAAR